MLGAMAAVVVLAIVFVLLGFLAGGHRQPSGVVIAALLIPLFICWIAFCIVTNLIFLFMAPVMYRQPVHHAGCGEAGTSINFR